MTIKKGGGLVRIWQNEIKHTYRYLDFIRHSYGTKFYSHILIHYINFSYSGALIREMLEVDEEVGEVVEEMVEVDEEVVVDHLTNPSSIV